MTQPSIAILDRDGNIAHLVQTSPFVPRSLTIAGDGTIWAAGNVLQRKSSLPDPDPLGGVLRHFDGSGRLLESLYPQSGLDDQVRTMQSYVSSSHDRVGWISSGNFQEGSGMPGRYIEITADGKHTAYALPPIAPRLGSRVYALAITADNSVFASGMSQNGAVGVFCLNRTTGLWKPVALPAFPAGEPFLAGASGGSLAVWAPSDGQVRFYTLE